MENWISYFTNVMQMDPNQIWLGLCLGTEEAINYCRLYLHNYVEDSVQKFMVLGPEEYEYRRTVNTASIVIQCWRELIAQADSTVLLDKRREDLGNYQLWRLKFIDHTNQRGQGPVFEICQWIFHTLAKEHKLATTLTFEKIEATAEDVIVLLKTLWQRANDIPYQPSTRVSFHGILLLAAIGGFRRATITSIKISFSMTLVPYSPIYLASIIAARAIKDNTFKNLVGVLTDALRNYILSNTTQVFQGSYQTKRVHKDLVKLAFRSMAGRNNNLFQSLHSMSLSQDAGAPINVSTENLGEFKKRRDMQGLHADLKKARHKDNKEIQSVKAQIKNLVKALSHLKLQEKRAAYFKYVDSLRAQGLPTTASLGKIHSSGALSTIAQFLQSCARELEEGYSVEQRAQHYMELLVNYLARRPSRPPPGLGTPKIAVEGGGDVAERAYDESVDLNRPCTKQSKCLLCDSAFRGRSELTKHCQKIHVKDGTFDRPFSCPECLRLGRGHVTITGGPPAWSRHAEASHGKMSTPNLPSIPRSVEGSERCLLCQRFFLGEGGLWRHTRRIHDQNGKDFAQPFSCPKCLRQGNGDASISGFDDWKNHVQSDHIEMEGLQPLPSRPCSPPDACSRQGSNGGKRKRTRDDADADPTVDDAGGDRPEDTEAASDTTCTTPATATNSMSNTQTPASSVELENIRNIDPRLLPDHLRQGSKKVKSSLFDDPEVVWPWATEPGPIVLSGSGTELEDPEGDCIPAADPQPEDHDLFYTGLLDAELHEPMAADRFYPQGQEGTEILENPPSEAITTSALAMIDLGDGYPRGMSSESLSPTHVPDDEDVGQLQPAAFIQYPAEEETEIVGSLTSALTIDPEDLSHAAKLYWGRGYALVPEGRELNRTANNAQRHCSLVIFQAKNRLAIHSLNHEETLTGFCTSLSACIEDRAAEIARAKLWITMDSRMRNALFPTYP
ncbi:uncharacterized protein CC84DRAFT_1171913 [Paraphaeosphaeria sporulosa]|uniref:C2H2-type domain-containing protein n=1 Tax=Paraphaeosphaeria sporulosa TaxID=1460663 RepID=A0A177CRC6_9PLEO|nr:uncharacterized protein CC84DRAFT_1171913 [Paraphaeosphaeria sporulosa]OAG09319.1 hypothetical protein CC84DRAFT_1171913 [Paraphaeosphaeria sporulosa]